MIRFLSTALPLCLAFALIGCAPSKSDIEKSIKDEMKSGMNVEITAVNLTKGADGGYTGTATAANGDTYDVVAQPPKGSKSEWSATPSQATMEKMLRDMINGQNESKVKTMELTKQGPGAYTGMATLENGAKLKVTTTVDGKNISMRADPVP